VAVSGQAIAGSERADACLAGLDDAGRATARRVLLRLASFDLVATETPRQESLAALRGGDDPERFVEVAHRLSEAGLLAIEGDLVVGDARVAHGSQSAGWPVLEAWRRTHRDAELRRRQLEADAASWRQRPVPGRGDAGLLDPEQLSELAGWLTPEVKRDLGVSEAAESFIAASRAAARRGWWPRGSVTSTVLVMAMMLLVLATPIILLFMVVLTASVIHKLGG
jgi:hypothetical protein